ncbi:glycosyltransferase family 4 protein [Tropicibacter oceani]|uniref:Glycosyltransferase family 4 protein n=1 Tax=Tropicibacter oceani TaxID=3058420 RepID=A0ABY8QIN0_9RHOB|nr:glycosyltransferase family 4 protein [Tropicibacter oceani]WGW04492.1 glycosyltransferase family 4 protein [Tropicibacter oceani]
MHILLLANSSFKLVNFRAGLIQRLLEEGHQLTAVAPRDAHSDQLEAWGLRYVDLPMNATGTSPIKELGLLLRIARIIRRERPDAILGYTIKPNIYGALSARLTGIPFLPNVTGLGTAFDHDGFFSRLIKTLYRAAFRRCPRVFLQNPEDRDVFLHAGLIAPEQAFLLPGSGVDLKAFSTEPLPGKGGQQTFLLVARMLREKGVIEFVEAARKVAKTHPQARFLLLGPFGEGKAGGLERDEIAALTADGVVEHLGAVKDVRPALSQADCVVLPSYYREGTPRSLLEAAAKGRPIITTHMPGCKDVVEPGKNGYLVNPRDSDSLAEAMTQFLDLDDDARVEMGKASRSRMETRFDEQIVIDAYLEALTLPLHK